MKMGDTRVLVSDAASTAWPPPPSAQVPHDLLIVRYGDEAADQIINVYVIDSASSEMMGGNEPRLTRAEIDRLLKQMEPCKSDDHGGPFAQEWQRRRSRAKNKSPLHMRVEKRRRRTQLAKETRKLMKLAEQRREAERAKLARKK